MEEGSLGYRVLSPDDLRKFMQVHGERNYELIDVREREEYQVRHLPGARLLPLSELEGRLDQIRTDKHTVFYCGSGKRSERAAMLVGERMKLPDLYSLDGGLMAWDGETLPDFPKMHVFDTSGTLEEVVVRAMDLEKGAERLYQTLVHYFEGSEVVESLRKLLAAEEAHARLLYGLLTKVADRSPRSFEDLYGSMKGEVLESGETYEQVLNKVRGIPAEKRWALLELALDMEFHAYDLYRNLAAVHPGSDLEDVLLKLAAQEKLHFRMVLEGLGKLASEKG